MTKNNNKSFTITIGNITHTFTYFSKENKFRVSSHHNLLNETKFKDFFEPNWKEIAVTHNAYLQARLFFMDVMNSHFNVLFAPIENKYYELPF